MRRLLQILMIFCSIQGYSQSNGMEIIQQSLEFIADQNESENIELFDIQEVLNYRLRMH